MAALDVVNRVLREFRRYTGDGLPGEPANAPLPVGDPSSGRHDPKKSELRAALLAPIVEAEAAADRAEQAVADAEAMIVPDGAVTDAKVSSTLSTAVDLSHVGYTPAGAASVKQWAQARQDAWLLASDKVSAGDLTAIGAGTVASGLGAKLEAAFQDAMTTKRRLIINRGNWKVNPFEGSGNLAFGHYLNHMIDVEGEGVDQTILTNLNANSAFIRCGGGFSHKFGNLTIDQNNSVGNAFTQGGQGSVTRDVKVVNQKGAGWAFVVPGGTFQTLDNIVLTNCVRGMDIGEGTPVQYLNAKGIRIESDTDAAGNAIALRLNTVSNSKLDVYIDGGDTGLGYSRANLVLITNCQGVDFIGLGTEVADGGLTATGFIEIKASRSINFFGGRAYIYNDAPTGKALFALTGEASEGILIEGFDWRITKNNSYFFFEDAISSGTPKNISVRNISGLVGATGCYGVFLDPAPVPQNVIIENFQLSGTAIQHYLGAVRMFLANVPQNVVAPTGAGGYFINQSGTLTGAGAGSITRV